MISMVAALSLAAVLLGQPAPAVQPPVPAEPAYAVGPEDVLNIVVFNEPELSGRFTVDSEGAITFPLVGRVVVDGQTPRAIEQKLTELLAQGYLVNPQVTVTIEQYRSQRVFVTGEVRSPGAYALKGNMTLLEVLAQAGGTTADAGSELLIIRPKSRPTEAAPLSPGTPDDPSREITRIRMQDVLSGNVREVVIRDGDTVYVPKAQRFYVTGHVRTPGSFIWEPGLTVQQAVAMAGGVTERGSLRRVRIFRIVGGKRTEVRPKLTDLVQPNDTIEVPQRLF
jgi:polysaccharide export outer membrane protein